jgi:hypothetical protein
MLIKGEVNGHVANQDLFFEFFLKKGVVDFEEGKVFAVFGYAFNRGEPLISLYREEQGLVFRAKK